MTWKPPKSESAWEECLWAYLDGELSFSDKRALESVLARHPERAARLETLRRSSALLREWTVGEAPAPDAAFLRELDRLQEKKRSRWLVGWFGLMPRLAPFAAIFIAGVAVGVFGTSWMRGDADNKQVNRGGFASQEIETEINPISPTQAEALFARMDADARSAELARRQEAEYSKMAFAAEKERLKKEWENRRARSPKDDEFHRRIAERWVRLAKL